MCTCISVDRVTLLISMGLGVKAGAPSKENWNNRYIKTQLYVLSDLSNKTCHLVWVLELMFTWLLWDIRLDLLWRLEGSPSRLRSMHQPHDNMVFRDSLTEQQYMSLSCNNINGLCLFSAMTETNLGPKETQNKSNLYNITNRTRRTDGKKLQPVDLDYMRTIWCTNLFNEALVRLQKRMAFAAFTHGFSVWPSTGNLNKQTKEILANAINTEGGFKIIWFMTSTVNTLKYLYINIKYFFPKTTKDVNVCNKVILLHWCQC